MKSEEKIKQFSIEKQALYALELAEQKIKKIESSINEPIAIIGMNCKFPSGINSKEDFWEFLNLKKEGISEIPSDRWSSTYFNEDRMQPGKTYAKYGAFVDDIFGFDAHFFGISSSEAKSMDPQQRLLLETTWHALEDAGIVPQTIKQKQVGIFVGIGQIDYGLREMGKDNISKINAYSGPGLGGSFAAGRLAYFLGTQGPAVALDTACSSALVSVHQACNSLRSGECEMAIAGGVHLMLSPEITITLSKAGALSPNGKCSTFSDQADGYVRGEGCGMIVLKKLSDAEKDEDHILAVIKGSAVNHDGPSSGLTVPNGKAQEALITQALENAKVSGNEISFIETHGTGTPLGDPIEVEAIVNTLGKNRSENEKLILGAVKTNIGHLEPAAGIAGLIKIVMAMQHSKIPGNLNFEKANPILEIEKQPVKIVTETVEWNVKESKKASLNAFGLSGTNAHMIFEEAQKQIRGRKSSTHKSKDSKYPFMLSAKTLDSLKALATNYIEFLNVTQSINIEDLSFNMNVTRSIFTYRIAFLAKNKEEVISKLEAFLFGDFKTNENTARITQKSSQQINFLFPGQGVQYEGFGVNLYLRNNYFKQQVDQCILLLNSDTQKVLQEAFSNAKNKAVIHNPKYASLYLFMVEYAIAKYWIHLGIKPSCLSGYSLGEFVSATIAEVMSLENALQLVEKSSLLIDQLKDKGTLLTVFETEEVLQDIIEKNNWRIAIAAVNGNANLSVSGAREEIAKLMRFCETHQILATEVEAIPAYHSYVIEPILKEFEAFASQFTYTAPKIPVISSLDGKLLKAGAINAAYWCGVLRNKVCYDKVITTLSQKESHAFLEMGPNTMLLSLIKQSSFKEQQFKDSLFLPLIRKAVASETDIYKASIELFLKGIPVEWKYLFNLKKYTKISLPLYSFNKSKKFTVERIETDTSEDTEGIPQDLQGSVTTNREATIEEIIYNQIIEVSAYSVDDIELINESTIGALGLDSLLLMNIREQLILSYPELKTEGLSLFSEEVYVADLIIGLKALVHSKENSLKTNSPCDIVSSIILSSIKEVVPYYTDNELLCSAYIEALEITPAVLTTINTQIQASFPEAEDIPASFFTNGYTVDQFINKVVALIPGNTIITDQHHQISFEAILEEFKVWEKDFVIGVVPRIDKKLVHKDYETNVLVSKIDQQGEDVFIAEINQDTTHPFFYEHAKDHVTGIYMLEAISQIARAIPHLYYDIPYSTSYVINNMDSNFTLFAETNKPLFAIVKISDKAYKNGALHYLKLSCDLIQNQTKIGTINGLGQLIDGTRYAQMREESLSKI